MGRLAPQMTRARVLLVILKAFQSIRRTNMLFVAILVLLGMMGIVIDDDSVKDAILVLFPLLFLVFTIGQSKALGACADYLKAALEEIE